MRFNTLFKLSSLLTYVGLVYGSGYRMSFYGVNGNRPSDSAIPACGTDAHYNTDYYIALNQEQYTASQRKSNNPNTASVCDKCVKISYKNDWVVGRIVDSCPGCPYKGLDVSPTIFEVFADRDVGILYMDWEYTDCSLLGKSSKSGGSSGSSSNKKTTRKVSTRQTTTKTVKKTTNAKTVVKPTNIPSTKAVAKTLPSKSTQTSKTLPTNVIIPKLGGITVNATNNTAGNINPNGVKQVPLNNAATKVVSSATKETKNIATSKPNTETVENVISENNEDGESNYILPITGALAVSGAAGIALVYVKRDSKNVAALREKFPEAFSNIKRSISRGSTVVKRSLSQSGKALKRSLSKKGDASAYGAAGPQIRTKKEYRDSLDAHYPLQPVQLYDPPVQNASNDYANAPQYNLQNYNTNEDDCNLRIDFHDSYPN